MHFADELLLHLRLGQHVGHQLIQVSEHQVRLVVRGRIQGRQGEPPVVDVGVLEHRQEHVEKDDLQSSVEGVIAVGQGVTDGLDGHAPDPLVLVTEQSLYNVSHPWPV